MAEAKDTAVANTTPLSKTPDTSDSIASNEGGSKDAGITLAQRGVTSDDEVTGDEEDAIRRHNRTLLSAQEEKALLRRIDWRIMTICSVLFLLKNIDADNISNARIMNKGTDRNIMTELNMTSDQYNLLNVLYYVCTHDL